MSKYRTWRPTNGEAGKLGRYSINRHFTIPVRSYSRSFSLDWLVVERHTQNQRVYVTESFLFNSDGDFRFFVSATVRCHFTGVCTCTPTIHLGGWLFQVMKREPFDIMLLIIIIYINKVQWTGWGVSLLFEYKNKFSPN